MLGTEDLLANATTAPASRENVKTNIRNKMAERMGQPFNALVMAAEESKEVYEDQAKTIAALSATIKKLSDKVATLYGQLTSAAVKASPAVPAPQASKEKIRDP